MKMIHVLIAAALLITSAAASTDPFVGKWKLNVKQSKYPAGTCPKKMVIEMASTKQGVQYRSETTYENGRTIQTSYTADYNGMQAMVVTGRGMFLPVSLKRFDSNTVVASYTRGLQLVATSRRVVSRNGRLMTITTKSKDPSGKDVYTKGVYEKQ